PVDEAVGDREEDPQRDADEAGVANPPAERDRWVPRGRESRAMREPHTREANDPDDRDRGPRKERRARIVLEAGANEDDEELDDREERDKSEPHPGGSREAGACVGATNARKARRSRLEAIYDPAESQRKGRIVTINFGVNYLAVIVAAIAAVVIGILYYGVLGVGDRQSRMLGASQARPGPVQGATGLIVGLVNAWVIAVLALSLGASSVVDAILLGVLVWLG